VESVVDAKCDIAVLGLIPRNLFATDGAISHILEASFGERVDLTRMTSAAVTDPAERCGRRPPATWLAFSMSVVRDLAVGSFGTPVLVSETNGSPQPLKGPSDWLGWAR
jgi:hypothetical protein